MGRGGREVGACRGAGLVAAVRAVAVVVVDPVEGDLDCRVGDAGEGVGVFVEFRDYTMSVSPAPLLDPKDRPKPLGSVR